MYAFNENDKLGLTLKFVCAAMSFFFLHQNGLRATGTAFPTAPLQYYVKREHVAAGAREPRMRQELAKAHDKALCITPCHFLIF